MSNIGKQIPESNFEIIRDYLCSVLALELGFQASGLDEEGNPDNFDGDSDIAGIKVWCERIVAFDKIEMPAVNVSISANSYDNEITAHTTGKLTFNIDIYASSLSQETEGVIISGDILAKRKLHKIIRYIKAILNHEYYDSNLGIDRIDSPVTETYLKEWFVPEIQATDTETQVIARMPFEVTIHDESVTLDLTALDGFDTITKHHDSDKGIYFSTILSD